MKKVELVHSVAELNERLKSMGNGIDIGERGVERLEEKKDRLISPEQGDLTGGDELLLNLARVDFGVKFTFIKPENENYGFLIPEDEVREK